MDLKLRYYVEEKQPAAVQADGINAGDQAIEEGTEKEVSKSESYIMRAIQLLPAEVLVVYPAALTFLLSFDEYWRHTLASITALVSIILLRQVALSRNARPQGPALGVSLIVCVLWIYSMAGFAFIQFNPDQSRGVSSVLLMLVGLAFPLFYKGEKMVKEPR